LRYTLSAVLISRKLNDRRALAEASLLAAQFYNGIGDLKAARAYGQSSLNLFQEQHNAEQTGQAYLLLWRVNVNSDVDDSVSIAILEKAAGAFHTSGNKIEEGGCYKELGDLLLIQGEVMASFTSLRNSLSIFEQIKYPRTQGVYDLLGMAYLRMGDYKAALASSLRAVAIAQQLGDTGVSLATYYNRLGSIYSKVKDPVRAELALRKGLAIDQQCRDTNGIFFLSYNIVAEMLNQSKAAEALHFINTLRQKYPTFQDQSYSGYNLLMIRMYTALGQYAAGEPYSKRIEDLANEKELNDRLLPIFYNGLIPYHIGAGNWEKATALALRYRKHAELNGNADAWSFSINVEACA
ncbi:MAG: tetratricopeptide repeat protein, partial [Sphingobacteriales bacterium]